MIDIDSGKVSKSATERFGVENGVEVCTMRWLGRPRPSGQHASVVGKVATKEDAEKLLSSDSVTLGGSWVIVSPFKGQRTPVACFKCRRFGHSQRLQAARHVRHVRPGRPSLVQDGEPALREQANATYKEL